MKTQNPGRMRLSLRLAILIFLVEALLLGAFAVTIYFYCRKVFYDSMDFALQANAESLATLVEKEEDEDRYELEFAGEVIRRFSRKKRPDLFAIILKNGNVFEKSRYLEKVPPFEYNNAQNMHFNNFRNKGHHYRGVLLTVEREVEHRPDQKFLVRVFFASSTHQLREDLEEIAKFLGWFFGVGLFLSGFLAGIVSWRGLGPLRRLAKETGKIRADSLDRRLPTHHLPRDLIPLAEAVNDMLNRLETAFEREKHFSADAAHELRTPVATLKSGIQAALLAPPDAQTERRVLRELLVDVERLESLCDSLLLMAKEQISEKKYGLSVSDWIKEIQNTLESLQPFAVENESCIKENFPENIPPGLVMKTDALSTRRITMNLLDNAIRHCGTQTTISVEIGIEEAEGILIVQDEGPGINPEDARRLFQRFFRADKSRTRATGGLGLGLAISRTLARFHGGDVLYSAINPHGSRFTWRCVIKNPRPETGK